MSCFRLAYEFLPFRNGRSWLNDRQEPGSRFSKRPFSPSLAERNWPARSSWKWEGATILRLTPRIRKELHAKKYAAGDYSVLDGAAVAVAVLLRHSHSQLN